jgi:hypothetical protein
MGPIMDDVPTLVRPSENAQTPRSVDDDGILPIREKQVLPLLIVGSVHYSVSR